MYIKIVSDSKNRKHLFECDEYDITHHNPRPENQAIRDDCLYLYWPDEGEPDSYIEMWLGRGGFASRQILLFGVTVYIMNDDGKTIDTIYA